MAITTHVTVAFPPDKLPEFYNALRPLYEQLTQEEKCVSIDVYEIMGQPGAVRLVEVWDCDFEWMVGVQAKKEYYQPFFAAVLKLALEPQKVEIMEAVEGFKFQKS